MSRAVVYFADYTYIENKNGMIEKIKRKILIWRSNKLRRKIILAMCNRATDNVPRADEVCYFAEYTVYFLIHGEYPKE